MWGGVPLACLKHTASVHPGPGSNPQNVTIYTLNVKTLGNVFTLPVIS